MAKKHKNPNKPEVADEDKLGAKLLSGIIVFLIVVVWLGIFAALIKFDVGNFGSQILAPVLKDVPILNAILPKLPEEEGEVTNTEDGTVKVATMSQALAKIEELTAENEALKKSVKDLTETKDELTAEVDRLKIFETNQDDFKKQKDEFYEQVVYGKDAPSADTYTEWYSRIDPASAAEIYRKVIANQQQNEEIQNLAKTFAAMKPTEAASVLETMKDDLDEVTKILLTMKPEERALIMGKMKPEFAGLLSKKMYPYTS